MPRRGSEEWPVVPPDASWLSPPRASPRRISRYVEYVARSSNAVHPSQVGELVDSYATACDAAGLDPLLVLCQLLVETDGFTSPSPRLRCDPRSLSGAQSLTATSPRTWADVARFHTTRLLAGALPVGGENLEQRVLLDELGDHDDGSTAQRGKATTLEEVARAWAPDSADQYLARLLEYTDSILMPQY